MTTTEKRREGRRLGASLGSALHRPKPASKPPPRKKGWDHSERVLVYYAACPEAGMTDGFGIAYYHYNPPYHEPYWVDFNDDRQPVCWWPLPTPPNAPHELPGAKNQDA